MNRLHSTSKHQHGFTLIEFMVVMALIAMALAITVINFSEAEAKRKATQSVSDMKELIYQARMLKDPIAKYAGISEFEVATQPGFPQKLCSRGNCATYGIESYGFGSVYAIYPYGSGFYITITANQEDCVALGSRMIFDVDEIRVYPSALFVFTNYVRRATVRLNTASKSARDYFYYKSTMAPAGVCRYVTNYMHFYVYE